MIKFNTVGRIVKGEYLDWYLVLIDKVKNGIYIFQSDNIEFNGINGGIVYDNWVKDFEGLEKFFSESEWEINWLEIENPKI